MCRSCRARRRARGNAFPRSGAQPSFGRPSAGAATSWPTSRLTYFPERAPSPFQSSRPSRWLHLIAIAADDLLDQLRRAAAGEEGEDLHLASILVNRGGLGQGVGRVVAALDVDVGPQGADQLLGS